MTAILTPNIIAQPHSPVILYDNRFDDAVPTATDSEAGYDVLNIRDSRGYTLHKFAGSGTKRIEVDCGSAKEANALGVFTHNLYTAAATLTVQHSSNGTDWTTVLTLDCSSLTSGDKALLVKFTSATARYWAIQVVTASVTVQWGEIKIGKLLEFEYPCDAAYKPLSETIKRISTIGKTGNLLGVINQYYPMNFTPSFSNFTRAWVFGGYHDFWNNHAKKGKPFFWAWDLDTFPDHVFWVAVTDAAAFDASLKMLRYVDRITLPMTAVSEDV